MDNYSQHKMGVFSLLSQIIAVIQLLKLFIHTVYPHSCQCERCPVLFCCYRLMRLPISNNRQSTYTRKFHIHRSLVRTCIHTEHMIVATKHAQDISNSDGTLNLHWILINLVKFLLWELFYPKTAQICLQENKKPSGLGLLILRGLCFSLDFF